MSKRTLEPFHRSFDVAVKHWKSDSPILETDTLQTQMFASTTSTNSVQKWRLILLVTVLAVQHCFAHHCIPSGDETEINRALNSPRATAILCRNSIFNISTPIVLSANGQRLMTEMLPTQKGRAVIRVASPDLSNAVFSRASGISVDHVVIQGGREEFGRASGGGDALIELGGDASNISVDHILASNPRGWSVIHIFEGSERCANARITNSEFGPAGHPDGDWADAVSFACRNGLIQSNKIVDASDGGIVIFGAPGTFVTDNLIETQRNTLLGGINLVDYKPFAGDYRGVVVERNRIIGLGGYIKVGIAVGSIVWGWNVPTLVRGAKILNNEFLGDNIGIGIATGGTAGVTIAGNVSHAIFKGVKGPGCKPGFTGPGHPYLMDKASSNGIFQKDFEYGIVDYAICTEEYSAGTKTQR